MMNSDNKSDAQKTEHQRRVRYQGTHPKDFKDKYKELNPEYYSEDIARVIQKGRTPAGMHIPVCVKEILKFLQIKPGQQGLDATLGYGGHTEAMLDRLNGSGKIYGLDVDMVELPKTTARLTKLGYSPDLLETRVLNFSEIDQLIAEVGPFNFILADLGVSSMQLDNPRRGFSYKLDGPLDLRLNPRRGRTAEKRLRKISLYEMRGMLTDNADEPHAEIIAKAIIAYNETGKHLMTTTQLSDLITEALMQGVPKITDEEIKKSCQRCFQAIRIDVNREYEVLEEFLRKLPDALAPGGRVAILTFHSGEDRLVKKSFKGLAQDGIYSEVARRPIQPSIEEIYANSRSRSAKLRWAIKV